MAEYLAVDKDGSECKLFDKPVRGAQFWYGSKIAPEKIQKGTITALIGRRLTWEDEPFEIANNPLSTQSLAAIN